MNLRNNNRQIIKKLAAVNFKENRGRNRILLITVIISFVIILLTFSMLNAYYQSQYIQNARISGEASSLRLSSPTEDQIHSINELTYVKNTVLETDLGYGKIAGVDSVRALYISDKGFDIQYALAYTDIKGDYPKTENEIMLSQRTLAELGISTPELGMNVFIDHNGENVFVLSGFFTDYSEGIPSAFFSEKHLEKTQGQTQEYLIIFDDLDYSVIDVRHAIEEDIQIAGGSQMISGDSFNLTYIMRSDNSYGIYLILVLAILLCAVFLINSSLTVSLNKDIKTFALYKILGTTNSQLATLILRQIARVSLVGVVIGVIIGPVLVLLIVPYLAESMYLMEYGDYPLSMCLSWIYFLIAIPLVFIIPILSSCSTIIKISKMPPLKAKRIGQSSGSRKVFIPGKLSLIDKMALGRWIKGRSNFFAIVAPLIIGITIILCLSSWMNTVHLTGEKDENAIEPDFNIMTFEYIVRDNEKHYITDSMEQEISDLPGVAQVNVTYGDYFILNAKDAAWQPLHKAYNKSAGNYGTADGNMPYECAAVVLDNEKVRELEDYLMKTNQNINMDKFNEGSGVICVNGSKLEGDLIREGESIKGTYVELSNRDMSVTDSFEFLGYMNISWEQLNELGSVVVSYAMPRVLISENGMEKIGSEKYIHEIKVYVEQTSEPTVKRQITSIINKRNLDLFAELQALPEERSEYISLTSASDQHVLQENINISARIIIWGVGILLVILVMAQYFSVLLTNLTSREKELFTLNALGMTESQIKALLRREGLFFGVISSILLILFGSGIIGLFNVVAKLYRPHMDNVFPWNEMLTSVAIIIAISIILPPIMLKVNKAICEVFENNKAIIMKNE